MKTILPRPSAFVPRSSALLCYAQERQALLLTYGRLFAEFLKEESLVPLGLLALSTSVGFRYGCPYDLCSLHKFRNSSEAQNLSKLATRRRNRTPSSTLRRSNKEIAKFWAFPLEPESFSFWLPASSASGFCKRQKIRKRKYDQSRRHHRNRPAVVHKRMSAKPDCD